MYRKRTFWLILILLGMVGGGAYAYAGGIFADDAETSEEAPVQTTVARQGNITISAAGAGTVLPVREVDLSFQQNGVLAELLVQVGDRVQAGDVLARLDDTDAQQALTNAQFQVKQAAIRTDPESTSVGASLNAISIEQAEINLASAQEALDSLLNWEPDEDEIALAEANLAAAEASYESALGQESASGYNVQVAKINLEDAQEALIDAQSNYDAVWDEARDWEQYYNVPICDPGEREPCTGQTWAERIERERASATSGLERAEDNVTLQQIEYERTRSSSVSSGSANATIGVLNAEQALEAALDGPTEEEIEGARESVRQAELALLQARLNQEMDAISLDQARLNMVAAQEAVEQSELIAPIDGTVMSIAADVGEMAGTSPLIVLADLERPMLEVFLDETDLDKVGPDYEVEVVFDALPDETFSGRVVQVDPQLSQISGVSAVRAVVQLEADSFTKPQTLPVGLNATVEVIGGRAEGATLVPVEALRELSPGEYAVFVMEDGEPKLRLVEVGLVDFTFAEILSGVEPGETITTGVLETG